MRDLKRNTRDRARAEARGRSAETLAMLMLMAKGYRVMARRFRSPVGEIDLVMRRGRTLAFVEVKARASTGAAAEAITMRQRDRLVAACRAWLASNPRFAEYNIRFDAVLVAPYRLPRHMRDAFQARL